MDEELCRKHSEDIATLIAHLELLPEIAKKLDEVKEVVCGSNGQGLAEVGRQTAEKLEGHVKNHRTFNRILLAIFITVASGILLKLVAG